MLRRGSTLRRQADTAAASCRSRSVRLAGAALAAVAVATGVGVAGAAPAAADHMDGPVRGAAYVWAHNPTAAEYTPTARYSRNTATDGVSTQTHRQNTIRRRAVGEYYVFIPDLGAEGGVAHVTAYGHGSEHCNVDSATRYDPKSERVGGGTDQLLLIKCWTADGRPVDTRFAASFTNYQRSESGGDFAYVNHYATLNTDTYAPVSPYQYNSAGGVNTVTRLGTGTYRVSLPNVHDGGNVQVTSNGYAAQRCKWALSWPTSKGLDVYVQCYTPDGKESDGPFALTYARHNNTLGASVFPSAGGRESAYAVSTGSSWTSRDGTATVTCQGVGRYTVRFKHGSGELDLSGGTVSVSAAGYGSSYCKVAWWNSRDGIQVRCFNVKGEPVNTTFTVSYASNWKVG